MAISTVTPNTTTTSSSPQLGATNVSTQQFLTLLVDQMKNQDPMQPMDNTQFVTQLAQFSTLETLQQIQSSLDSSIGAQILGQSINLIGKSVTATPAGGAAVTGTVQGVSISGSNVTLNLGTSSVNLFDVQSVDAASTTPASTTPPSTTPTSATSPGTTSSTTPNSTTGA